MQYVNTGYGLIVYNFKTTTTASVYVADPQEEEEEETAYSTVTSTSEVDWASVLAYAAAVGTVVLATGVVVLSISDDFTEVGVLNDAATAAFVIGLIKQVI